MLVIIAAAVAVVAAVVVPVVLLAGGSDDGGGQRQASPSAAASVDTETPTASPSADTGSPAPTSSPEAHPEQIACVIDNENIWVCDVDGGDRTQLTYDKSEDDHLQSAPAWSPDGARLAYIDWNGVTNDLGCRLWVIDADGGNDQPLLPEGVLGDAESISAYGAVPAWSADGGRVAFVNVMDTEKAPENTWSALFVFDLAAQTAKQVYRVPKNWLMASLAWSPDGKRILFTVDNEIAAIADGGPKIKSELKSIDLETGELSLGATATVGHIFVGLDYAPDGETIAFTLSPFSSGLAGLLTGEAAGGKTHIVVSATDPATSYGVLSWSPDGRRIAYEITRPSGQSVWIVGTDGKDDHRAVAGGSQPSWRP